MITRKTIDESTGIYRSHSQIYMHEGYNATAARNYVMSCIQLRGAWVSWNGLSKQWEFFHLERRRSEIMEESFKIYKQAVKEGDAC